MIPIRKVGLLSSRISDAVQMLLATKDQLISTDRGGGPEYFIVELIRCDEFELWSWRDDVRNSGIVQEENSSVADPWRRCKACGILQPLLIEKFARFGIKASHQPSRLFQHIQAAAVQER